MKEFNYFRINSIEELKKAYHMFEYYWDKDYSLENEIEYFNKGNRYVLCDSIGICLGDDVHINISYYKEIQSPIRNINNLNKLI